MVEQAIFFAIGFLVAALAAVLAAPVVSRRAMRLSEARTRLRAPLTRIQAAADRDALRAQHAAQEVRLERRLRTADESLARHRAEVGRQSAAIIGLHEEAAGLRAEIARQRAEIAAKDEDHRNLEGAFGTSHIALFDLTAQRDAASTAEAAALARQGELEAAAARDRARIAILSARADSLESRLAETMRSAEAAARAAKAEGERLKAVLLQEKDDARRLEMHLREVIVENEIVARSLAIAETSLAETGRRLAGVEETLARSETAREDTLIENGRQLAAIAERDAALAKSREAMADLDARHAADASAAKERETILDLEAQALRTAHATMEGALRAARDERETLQRENETLRLRVSAALSASQPAASGQDDAALREAIAKLGREFVKQYQQGRRLSREDGPSSLVELPMPEAVAESAGLIADMIAASR